MLRAAEICEAEGEYGKRYGTLIRATKGEG